MTLPGGHVLTTDALEGLAPGAHHVSIRPERLAIATDDADLTARVERLIYLGTDLQLLARLADGTPIVTRLQNSNRNELPAAGAEVGLHVEAGAARLLLD